MDRYCAFDFELANSSPTSICSIGAVLVENNKVVKTYYSEVKPVPFQMIQGCFRVHHIPLKRLQKQKTFKQVWEEVKDMFEGSTIISHDVFQDSRCLRAVLDYYKIDYPVCKMSCSFVLSKRLLSSLPSHKLSDIMTYYNFPYQPHHALDDAFLTKCLIQKMKEIYGVESVDELNKLAKFKYGYLRPHFYKNVYISELVHDQEYNMNGQFYEKVFCIENLDKEAYDSYSERIKKQGGYIQKKVNTSTDYLITDLSVTTKNQIQAKKLIEAGQDLQIIKITN